MQTVVRKTVSLNPGDAVVENALAGTDLEFAPKSGTITPFLSADVEYVVDLRTPSQQIANQASTGTSANNPPQIPDDLFAGPYQVSGGERSILRVSNPGDLGGNIFLYFQFEG